MRDLRITSQFKKDLKKAKQRGKKLEKINTLINDLRETSSLDPKYLDHALTGDKKGSRDCHIEPDWLLIYKIVDNTLVLIRTGSHSDLFD